MKSRAIFAGLCLLVSVAPAVAQGTAYHLEQTQAAFEAHDVNERDVGRTLVDIELRYDAPDRYFSGLWAPVPGALGPPPAHILLHGDATAWANFKSDMALRVGRYMNGDIIVPNWTAFVGPWPVPTHVQDARGDDYDGYVWTGTTIDGRNQNHPDDPSEIPWQNCGNWTTRSTVGLQPVVGRFPTGWGPGWTHDNVFACSTYNAVLCVEQ